MNGQLDLLDYGARLTDPETSHAAAAQARTHAATDRDLVLAILTEHGPLTDFGIAAIARRQATSLGVRRGELCKLGLVEWSGGYAPSPSGTAARVWQVIQR